MKTLICLSLLMAGCLDKDAKPPEPKPVVDLEKARIEFMKAQAEVQLATQKRLADLQIAAVKACLDGKGMAIVKDGNVDCKVWK